MKKSYFPADGIWLKGNLHSHTTVSDGSFAPEKLAELYASAGYSFLSMTDHNLLVSHEDLQDKGLLMLAGVEHDLEYSRDQCTHVVGIAPAGKGATDYPCKRYFPEDLTDQQLIDMMCGDGQFVTLAHPVWSRMEVKQILDLQNFHAIEVFNNGTEHLCHGGNAEIYWELLLRHGRRVFATASDDVHVEGDLFGGWIWVKAAERTSRAIMDAVRSGAFYASSGPVLRDFGLDGGKVFVSCSGCREIHFVTYPPRGASFFAKKGEVLTEATHMLTGRERFARAVCVDHEGRSAWTNPIFFDERAQKE